MSAKHCSYCGKQLGPNRRVNDGQYFCEECWPRRGVGPRENPRHRDALLEDMSAVFSRYRFPMGRDEFLSMMASVSETLSEILFDTDDGPVRKSELFEVDTLDGDTLDGENAHPGMKRR